MRLLIILLVVVAVAARDTPAHTRGLKLSTCIRDVDIAAGFDCDPAGTQICTCPVNSVCVTNTNTGNAICRTQCIVNKQLLGTAACSGVGQTCECPAGSDCDVLNGLPICVTSWAETAGTQCLTWGKATCVCRPPMYIVSNRAGQNGLCQFPNCGSILTPVSGACSGDIAGGQTCRCNPGRTCVGGTVCT